MLQELTREQKASKLVDYFWQKYGEDRAKVIISKVGGSLDQMSYSDLVKVGEKWHWANLLFNDKVSSEEFSKAFHDLGYE